MAIPTPLVLSNVKFKDSIDISSMLEKFERDLSNREVIDQKILLLQKKKKKRLRLPPKDCRDILSRSIKEYTMKVDFQIYTFYIKLAALFQLVQQNVIIFSPQYED